MLTYKRKLNFEEVECLKTFVITFSSIRKMGLTSNPSRFILFKLFEISEE